MLDFPENTFFNRVIPKNKFYEQLPVTPAIKSCFVNEIEKIVWRNKLTAETLHVQPGTKIQEIEILEVSLKGEDLKDDVLRIIDRGIPYQLLFLLKRGEEYQACMGFKESVSAAVKEYYKSGWMEFSLLPLSVSGLTMDDIHANFIRQLNTRLAGAESSDLKEAIQSDKDRQQLEQQIARLEKQARAERQPRRKFELVQEIKRLREKCPQNTQNTQK